MIEDDVLPAGVFGAEQTTEEHTFVDDQGDRWFSKDMSVGNEW